MSLLSSTQGTPERVWSLVALLAVNDGTLLRSDALAWLNPGFTEGGRVVSEKPTTFAQVLGAATSLGAVEAEGDYLRLAPNFPAGDFEAFCDGVHDRLAALDSAAKDAVVLETFAWLAAESDRRGGTAWVAEETATALADAADKALPPGEDDDGARRINATKLPPWRRWLESLGLMVALPQGSSQPMVDHRLTQELHRASLKGGERLEADAFLALVARRLPYLDGGSLFAAAARRIRHAPAPRRLSPILSAALRDLHDEGVIELQRLGDSGSLVNLAKDASHPFEAFEAVIVKEAP